MVGWADEEEEETEFERVYEFYISGEPNVECEVGDFKVSLPISKLGIKYDRSEMVNHSWTYDTDPSHENVATDIEVNPVRLNILTIKGTSKIPVRYQQEWSRIIEDIKSFKNRVIIKNGWFELSTQNQDNKIRVCEEEYRYREVEITLHEFNKFLNELTEIKAVKKGIKSK